MADKRIQKYNRALGAPIGGLLGLLAGALLLAWIIPLPWWLVFIVLAASTTIGAWLGWHFPGLAEVLFWFLSLFG